MVKRPLSGTQKITGRLCGELQAQPQELWSDWRMEEQELGLVSRTTPTNFHPTRITRCMPREEGPAVGRGKSERARMEGQKRQSLPKQRNKCVVYLLRPHGQSAKQLHSFTPHNRPGWWLGPPPSHDKESLRAKMDKGQLSMGAQELCREFPPGWELQVCTSELLLGLGCSLLARIPSSLVPVPYGDAGSKTTKQWLA